MQNGRRDLTGATIAELRERDREWEAYQAERGRLVSLYQAGKLPNDGPEVQQLEEWFQRLAAGRPKWLANREPLELRRELARRGDPEAIEAERVERLSTEKFVLGHHPRNFRERLEVHAPLLLRLVKRRSCRSVPTHLNRRLLPARRPRARTRTRRPSRSKPRDDSDPHSLTPRTA